MVTLFNWNAKRAGGRITITHSSGKITGINTIQPENGKVIAYAVDGRKYQLHVENNC
jgi:hypothetical protein